MAICIKINETVKNRSSENTLRVYNEPPILCPITNNLLQFVFEYHKQGIVMMKKWLSEKYATAAKPFVTTQSKPGLWLCVIKSCSTVWCTAWLQKSHREKIATKKNLLGSIGTMTSVWICISVFLMYEIKTQKLTGVITIGVQKSTSHTKRAACAVSVTAFGIFVLSHFIFRGKPRDWIVANEFPNFPKEIVKNCVDEWSDNCWLSETSSFMVHCWCTSWHCALHSSWHVSMSHDRLCHKCNKKFGSGSLIHSSGCQNEYTTEICNPKKWVKGMIDFGLNDDAPSSLQWGHGWISCRGVLYEYFRGSDPESIE